jgi:hypothetical protein
MSDHLSDDMSKWPSDPYVLLGVERDADEKTVRRAYTRLIRRFRPEHHPNEFQQIREAYERVQQNVSFPASWDGLSATGFGSPSRTDWSAPHHPSRRPDSTEIDPQPTGTSSRAGESTVLVPDLSSLLDSDDVSGTLNKLDEQFGQHPECESVAVQRFWLLKLLPGGDDQLLFDWLAAQLKQHPHQEQVEVFLRRELEWDFTLAGRDSLSWLVESAAAVERRLDLLDMRWRAVAARQQCELIARELDQLEKAVRFDSPEVWVTGLLSSLGLHMWGDSAQKFEAERQRDALLGCEDLQLRMPAVFDDLDELDGLLSELQVPAGGFAQDVRPVLRTVSLSDRTSAYQEAWGLARRISENGIAGLNELASFATNAPFTFNRLHLVLASLNRFRSIEFRDDHGVVLAQLVEQLTASMNWATPNPDFTKVVTFCTEFGIPVRALAMLIFENQSIPEYLRNVAAQMLYQNIGLGLLVEASQVRRSAIDA